MVRVPSTQTLEAAAKQFIVSGGKGRPPETVEELLVTVRMVVTELAPKNRYNSMVITKIEEAELLWARGRGLA